MTTKWKWPRSLFARAEEWIFKVRRSAHRTVFKETIIEAAEFKALVQATQCPNCKHPLLLVKFERGPKGWEADVTCEACNFTGTVSSLCSVLDRLGSKGKARDAR